MSRRYKTHLRDFLSTCRSKRSYSSTTEPAYNNYNNAYSATTYAADTATSLYMNPQNPLQTLYPPSYIPTDNLFHYRQLGSYYPDYMTTHSYVSNGYMDTPRPCLSYDAAAAGLPKTPTADQKFYCSSQLDPSKYQYYSPNTVLPPLDHKYDLRAPSAELRREHTPLLPPSPASTAPPPPPSVAPSSAPLTPTSEGTKEASSSYSNDTRQTVLMWGSATEVAPAVLPQEFDANGVKKYSDSPTSSSGGNTSTPPEHHYSAPTGVQEAIPGAACKWGPPPAGTPGARSASGGSPHEGASPPGGVVSAGGKMGYYTTETGGDVWPHHQYYHYHHAYHTTQWVTQSPLFGAIKFQKKACAAKSTNFCRHKKNSNFLFIDLFFQISIFFFFFFFFISMMWWWYVIWSQSISKEGIRCQIYKFLWT